MSDESKRLAEEFARTLFDAFFDRKVAGTAKARRLREMVMSDEGGPGTVKDLVLQQMEAEEAESLRRQKARRFPPGVHLVGGQRAAETNRRMADEFYAAIIPVVVELHEAGWSLRSIGRELERRGFTPRLGFPSSRWHPMQVKRVLDRAGACSG